MNSFRDRLHFDSSRGEHRDGAIRYMMIRPDALMGLFARLPDHQRLTALQALAGSIQEFGGRSAQSYRALGATDAAAMLDTIAQTAPQLGWGVWTFRRDGASIRLDVVNSPFAAGAGASAHPVCHAIVGMLRAIGPQVMGGPVRAVETRCAAQVGGEPCHFSMAIERGLQT